METAQGKVFRLSELVRQVLLCDGTMEAYDFAAASCVCKIFREALGPWAAAIHALRAGGPRVLGAQVARKKFAADEELADEGLVYEDLTDEAVVAANAVAVAHHPTRAVCLPALVARLSELPGPFEVNQNPAREAAARAVGTLGAAAVEYVPALITLLQSHEEDHHPRSTGAVREGVSMALWGLGKHAFIDDGFSYKAALLRSPPLVI